MLHFVQQKKTAFQGLSVQHVYVCKAVCLWASINQQRRHISFRRVCNRKQSYAHVRFRPRWVSGQKDNSGSMGKSGRHYIDAWTAMAAATTNRRPDPKLSGSREVAQPGIEDQRWDGGIESTRTTSKQ